MKRLNTSLFVIVLVCAITSSAYADPLLTPYTYYEDFESGSVGAWSSYPPAQDTAYDPTIWVKPLLSEDAADRALFREKTANYEIDYCFGVRKKLDMYVNHSSTLSFRAYIKSNRNIDGVKLRFGFADGSMAERTIPFSTRLVWRNCLFDMADIIPRNTQKKLTAVAFMALCPNADPENLLRFGIDDVKITGLRQEQWRFGAPSVHKLDEWSDFIAATHYRRGDAITISGKPPFNAAAVKVVVSRALTKEDQRTFSMKHTKPDWSVTIPLTEQSGITAGFWRATIKALSKDKKDDTVSSSLVFLVKAENAPLRNPRLLMAPDDAGKIKEKASAGRMKEIWERIRKTAQDYRENHDPDNFNWNLDVYDEIYWLSTYGGYINAIRTPSNYIRSNGVVYAVSGDTVAGDAARRALLKMAEWPSFVHPHILNQGQFTYWPVGQILADLAIGYDMTADRFTPSERKKVAHALYSKGLTEVFKEYVRDNRVSSNTSNWIGDVTGGGILCALAVMNEFNAEQLEPYLTGTILKMNQLIVDGFDETGGYGEGNSYLKHALHCLNVAMPALERTFGIHFPDRLARCHEFLFYHLDSETKALYDFGDSADRLGRMSSFSYLITKHRDPHLKWLYDLSPGSSDVDLFLLDESVEAKAPRDLPTVRLFEDTGTAVFRSGFGHQDFIFIFRCGPFYNHQHFDQGGFYLIDRGEKFLGEVGAGDYYNDPWYQKLVIQPAGHNCILVNNNPQSQRAGDFLSDVPAWKNYAFITDFISFEEGAFVSGRLDPVYKGTMELIRRNVFYIKPRTILLIDEVVGTSSVKTVDLRFHAPRKNDIEISGKNVYITRPAGTLTIHTVAPAEYTAGVFKRPLTLPEFRSENTVTMKARGFLWLSAKLGALRKGTTFVNVLSTDKAIIAGLDEKAYTGHVVAAIKGTAYYINTARGRPYTEGAVTTDALVYAGRPDGYIAIRATQLSVDGEVIAGSDKPVSLLFKDGNVKTLTYSASVQTRLTLKLTSRPGSVTFNGGEFRNWKYNKKGGLSLELPKGGGLIAIK